MQSMTVISSVRWVALAQFSRVGAQLVSAAVLTRFLAPSDYGLMAMAMTITNLAFLFRDIGATPAIIQRPALSDAIKSTVFWINLLLGLAVALALLAVAYPVAQFYGEPRLIGVIAALAMVFPVSGLGILHQALLERESRFDLLARAEVTGAVVGLLASIALALHGAGIWSLVAQMLIAAVLNSAIVLYVCPFRAARRFCKQELASLIDDSASFSLFRVVTYFERNVDSLIIGKLLGSALLGIYALAIKIMLLPVQNLALVVSRAIFPALCRQRASRAAMADLYLRAVGAVSLVTAPAMAGIFVLREQLVECLFGAHWLEVANLLTWLAPAGFIQALTTGTGVVFLALGETRLLLRLGMFGATLMVAAFLIGPRWGIEAVAMCYLVANMINLLPCFYLSLKKLDIGLRKAAKTVGLPLLASLLMVLVLIAAMPAVDTLPAGAFVKLAILVAVGAAVYFFALLIVLRTDPADLKAMVAFR